MIHFRIGDATLCGAKYTEPSKKAAKDGRLCNDCIQVMWKEQYRRNTLIPMTKNIDMSKVKRETHVEDDSHRVEEQSSGLYLRDYLNKTLTI
tara:strand:+ start:5838 stop:6113 length:276 start_codon:yes stop_codon:yes gene_type:complete